MAWLVCAETSNIIEAETEEITYKYIQPLLYGAPFFIGYVLTVIVVYLIFLLHDNPWIYGAIIYGNLIAIILQLIFIFTVLTY